MRQLETPSLKALTHIQHGQQRELEVIDFGTAKGKGEGDRRGNNAPRFSTGSRTDKRHDEPPPVSSENRLVIPTGSRKSAFVHLALEAWRVGLLDPKTIGEVRGRDVDEDGLLRALYRSPVTDIEHALGPIVKGRKVVVEGRLQGTGHSAIERLGAEVEELGLEDERVYIDLTPAVFVLGAVAMAVRYVSLGLDDQSMYILAGVSFAVMYGLRPFFSKMQRPRD